MTRRISGPPVAMVKRAIKAANDLGITVRLECYADRVVLVPIEAPAPGKPTNKPAVPNPWDTVLQ